MALFAADLIDWIAVIADYVTIRITRITEKQVDGLSRIKWSS